MRVEPQLGDLDGIATNQPNVVVQHIEYVTPEQQRLNMPLASPGRRYLCQMIDLIITWVIFLLVLSLFNLVGASRDYTDLVSISVAAIYLVFSDSLPRGQSLGKVLLGMSVIDKDSGNYCSIWQSFIRNVMNPIIGPIDAIFILSRKRQRIGDLTANTIVIRR